MTQMSIPSLRMRADLYSPAAHFMNGSLIRPRINGKMVAEEEQQNLEVMHSKRSNIE